MNDQIQAILKQLSIQQRVGIVGAAIMAAAMIGVLVMFASKPSYTPAFTDLSSSDAATVESALRAANIPYQVADAGTTIEVPVESLGDARIAAGKAGVSTGGNDTKGWELFDNQGFGQSQFDQSVTMQRALEGELTKTIEGMEGVSSARVSVVLAQTGALSSQDTPASAAVVLSMTGGARPSDGLVQAIVATVARSVQGLSTDNVVVSDDKGNVYAGAANSASTAAAQAKDLVEQQTKSKIESLLSTALGSGHASVAVSADVDSSQVVQDVITYAPSGSNPPVSITTNTETYGGSYSGDACGIPGANSNVPGLSSYPGVCPAVTEAPSASPGSSPSASSSGESASGSTSSSGYIHQQTTINYNVSQIVEHIVTQPGVVKRLSVAVLVDEAALGTLSTDTLETTISAAIGIDSSRGDVVAVNAIPFAAAPTAAPATEVSPTATVLNGVGDMSGTLIGGGFALAMLALLWMNLGALRRRAEETVLDLGPGSVAGVAALAAAAAPSRAGIPASTQEALTAAADAPTATPQARIQERLRLVADERPEALAGLMNGWLREDDRRR